MFEKFRGLDGPRRPQVSTSGRRYLEVEELEARALLSAGFLDPSFGNAGVATAKIGNLADSSAVGAVVQPDGKIIVAGTIFDLARFNPDGTLDNTFGTSGEVTAPLGRAAGVVLQADGKIIVGGIVGGKSFAVARFNPDGSLDSTFGSGGTVTTTVNPTVGVVTTVLLQPDGKIVLVGTSLEMGPGGDFSTTELVRYNTDGSLDTSFGTGGKVTNLLHMAGTAALQPDGKIVVPETRGGSDLPYPFPTTWFLIRVNADGSQDSSFTPTIDERGGNQGLGVAIQGDGKIVTTGYADHSELVRLNPDGTLDTTFGVNGKVWTPVSGKVVIQGDGRILVAGYAYGTFGSSGLTRYLPDGSLDTRFGIDGSASSFPSGLAAGVTLQSDGSILVVGSVGTSTSTNTDLAVGRYQGGPSAALPGMLNQRFVEQLYLDVLGRPVDSSGLGFWSNLLDTGQASRTQVVLAIGQSAEYHSLVVENLYQQYLHRPADPSGLSTWTSFLAAGGTTDQLRAYLLGSGEYAKSNQLSDNPFQNLAFTGTALSFVNGLYHDVLYRTSDNAGALAWTQVLNNGASNMAVAAAFLASAEGASDMVQGLYHQLLHRAPDAVGLSQFSNMLEQGVSEELVMALIAGSDEYAAHL